MTVQKGDTNGGELGLSDRRIRELARWYEDQGYARRGEDGSIDQPALDAGLRQVLAEEVLPEFVEIEFERVLDAVFSV